MKFQSFKRELSEDNASSLELTFKRLKRDSYAFKKEGNKRQYEHQKKVLESFSEAQAFIISNKLEQATEKIEQGISLAKDRMKIIKLADGSEFDWKTAIEYEQDDLASDSDDEKRIQKSERAAERKLKLKRRKYALNLPTSGFQPAFIKKSISGQESAFGSRPYLSNHLPQPLAAPRFPRAGPCFKISILSHTIALFYILQRVYCMLSSQGATYDA